MANYTLKSFDAGTRVAVIRVEGCTRDTAIALNPGVTPNGILAKDFELACQAAADEVAQNMDPDSLTYDPTLKA